MIISSAKCPIPNPVKTVFIPAVAVGALIGEFEKHHSEHHQAITLANAMTGIGCSVFLHRMQKGLLPVIAGVAMWVRARKKESTKEKIKSVVRDTVWLGSGLLTLKYLSTVNKYNEPRGYIHNCLAFTVGALIVAPFINNRILGLKSGHNPYEGGDSFQPKHPEAYPISMDRYGIITKIVGPKDFVNPEEKSSQH